MNFYCFKNSFHPHFINNKDRIYVYYLCYSHLYLTICAALPSLPRQSAPTSFPVTFCLPLVRWSLLVIALSFPLNVVVFMLVSLPLVLGALSISLWVVRSTLLVDHRSPVNATFINPWVLFHPFMHWSISLSFVLSLFLSLCVVCVIMGKQIGGLVFCAKLGGFSFTVLLFLFMFYCPLLSFLVGKKIFV